MNLYHFASTYIMQRCNAPTPCQGATAWDLETKGPLTFNAQVASVPIEKVAWFFFWASPSMFNTKYIHIYIYILEIYIPLYTSFHAKNKFSEFFKFPQNMFGNPNVPSVLVRRQGSAEILQTWSHRSQSHTSLGRSVKKQFPAFFGTPKNGEPSRLVVLGRPNSNDQTAVSEYVIMW